MDIVSLRSEKVSIWRRWGGGTAQADTGLSARSPGLESCVEQKVKNRIVLNNLKYSYERDDTTSITYHTYRSFS